MTGLLGSLFSAGAGMRANQKWSEVTARNISNANTPGYVRKETQFDTRTSGGSAEVYVSRVDRQVDSSLLRMHRYETSKVEKQRAIAQGIEEYTAILGTPDEQNSPAASLSELHNSFIRLSNNPGSVEVQRTVVMAAKDLTQNIQNTSYNIDKAEDENNIAIRNEISNINEGLDRLASLNERFGQTARLTTDNQELLDERDKIIDEISKSMNVRIVERSDGRVSLYTGGGSELVDNDKVHRLSLDVAGNLMAGNVDITPRTNNPRAFQQGSLAGRLELRDETLPQFRLQLDELARGVIQTFENKDASLSAGQPGIFTDGGAAYDPANLEGLAGRIAVNDAVQPELGGQLWRVREGVAATNQVGSSFTGQIADFLAGFNEVQSFDPATGLAANYKIEDYASNMVAHQGVTKAGADTEVRRGQVSLQTIENSRLSVSGVSIDDELQKMALIERTYQANAQVAQTVAGMLDTLISIAR